MNPYKIYTLYYGKRGATTADYFLDDTSNIPIGMGYYFWVATEAARLLRIGRRTLHRKLKDYGLA